MLRQAEKERRRERKIERETDRQTTDRQTETGRDRDREIRGDRETEREIERREVLKLGIVTPIHCTCTHTYCIGQHSTVSCMHVTKTGENEHINLQC